MGVHILYNLLQPAFVSEFHDIGAQVGQSALPGRGLVLLHRGGSDQHVVFAMSSSYMVALLLLLLGAAYVVIRLLSRRRSVRRSVRWAGGIHRLLPEMTYTATGFSSPVAVVFRAIFRPRAVEDVRETVSQHFRTAIRRRYEEVHVVNRLVIHPLTRAARWISDTVARLHGGKINTYVVYVLLTLLIFAVVAWAQK